jgi:hypothetical protein
MEQCVAYILRLKIKLYFQALRELFCQLLSNCEALRTFDGYLLIKQTVRMAKQNKQRTSLVH